MERISSWLARIERKITEGSNIAQGIKRGWTVDSMLGKPIGKKERT
jgi:hypothetical protein